MGTEAEILDAVRFFERIGVRFELEGEALVAVGCTEKITEDQKSWISRNKPDLSIYVARMRACAGLRTDAPAQDCIRGSARATCARENPGFDGKSQGMHACGSDPLNHACGPIDPVGLLITDERDLWRAEVAGAIGDAVRMFRAAPPSSDPFPEWCAAMKARAGHLSQDERAEVGFRALAAAAASGEPPVAWHARRAFDEMDRIWKAHVEEEKADAEGAGR